MSNVQDDKGNLSVLLMAPNPESIGAVFADLLRRTQAENLAQLDHSERGSLDTDVRYYIDEVSKTILNWLGASRDDLVMEIIAQLQKHQSQSEQFAFEDLLQRDQLIYWSRVIWDLIGIYSRGDCLMKMLASVSGICRIHYQQLLVIMYRDWNWCHPENPDTGKLPSPLNEDGKYAEAVAGLQFLGYITSHPYETGHIGDLTFNGRRLARYLMNINKPKNELDNNDSQPITIEGKT